MENENGQEQTQGTWTIQNDSVSKHDTGGSTGIDGQSKQAGLESFSSTGKNWEGGNSVKPFICGTFGKIIDRLIDSWKDRQQEAEDCLTWYNDQIIKCDKEIKMLESIKTEIVEVTKQEE